MAVNRAPARAGDSFDRVDTPALMLALEPFQANLSSVARAVAQAGLRLRPHGKAHKCIEIARRQIAAGAVGICCQKVSEAEVFIDGGVRDVLVTNEVVGARKVDRLAALAGKASVGVCVDSAVQVAQLADAARRRGVVVRVLVEIDVGQGRCGVVTPQQAVALAVQINAAAPVLSFGGLQAYHGRAQHLREPAQRRDAIAGACQRVRDTVAALDQAGLACAEITGGGTGSFINELTSGLYTEVQPGSYVLMDADYNANIADPRAPVLQQPLTLLCTVISAFDSHVVLDAGLKSLSAESGLPVALDAGWTVAGISDEHVVMKPAAGARPLAVGDRCQLIPSHCDPTVNLHDWIVVTRGDTVDAVWPVDARGAMF